LLFAVQLALQKQKVTHFNNKQNLATTIFVYR